MASRILLFLCLFCSVRGTAQSVAPLLKTEWHQNEPYNKMCPTIDGERTMVGCVATSATEIMNIYQWPSETLDTLHGWETDKYVVADILPGAKLRWGQILQDYRGQYTEAQADAIAELSLYAAMACHMHFGVSSSGADTYSYLETLKPVFGYQYVHMYDRVYYSPATWRSILIYELQQGHPLLYTGYNQEVSGHAFVIDGYDSATGQFHAEWGYGGAYNGWFDIDVLNPFERPDDPTEWGRREGFFCNQTALAFAPNECQPYTTDSLKIDVSLDSIGTYDLHLGRSCEAEFFFTNNTADTLTYTYEVLSNEPQDTALFKQAEFVGVSSVTLLPHASASDKVLLRINKAGNRLFRVSHDDVTVSEPVLVSISSEKDFCEPGAIELLAVDDTSAMFTILVEGQGIITWCLFPDQSLTTDTDVRHWSLGSDTITFKGLKPNHEYTLVVRQPWEIRDKLTFTTQSTGVVAPIRKKMDERCYDIDGRPVSDKPTRRIYIKNGRKFVE